MGSSRSFFLSSLWREHKKCLLVITPTLNDAEDYYQELLFFVGKHEHAVSASTERKQIFLYPPDEEFPFADASRHPEITSQKIEGLHHLMGSDQPPIIVAPVTALIRKSIPRAVLARYSRHLQVGVEIDREELSSLLVKSGYLKVGIVEDRGDYSIRGGIVDVFSSRSATSMCPFKNRVANAAMRGLYRYLKLSLKRIIWTRLLNALEISLERSCFLKRAGKIS
jgi:transcription-repair coupling factor (superfamily II helicase)